MLTVAPVQSGSSEVQCYVGLLDCPASVKYLGQVGGLDGPAQAPRRNIWQLFYLFEMSELSVCDWMESISSVIVSRAGSHLIFEEIKSGSAAQSDDLRFHT